MTTLPLYLLFCAGWLLAFAYAIIREKEQQNGDMGKTIIANLLVFVVMTPIILSLNI